MTPAPSFHGPGRPRGPAPTTTAGGPGPTSTPKPTIRWSAPRPDGRRLAFLRPDGVDPAVVCYDEPIVGAVRPVAFRRWRWATWAAAQEDDWATSGTAPSAEAAMAAAQDALAYHRTLRQAVPA